MKLLASVLLSLSLLLSPSFSFSASNEVKHLKDADTCASNAQIVAQMIELRLNGVTKDDLLASIDFDSLPKDYKVQMTKDIKKAIDLVYSPKNKNKDGLVLVKEFINQCVKEPAYTKESNA